MCDFSMKCNACCMLCTHAIHHFLASVKPDFNIVTGVSLNWADAAAILACVCTKGSGQAGSLLKQSPVVRSGTLRGYSSAVLAKTLNTQYPQLVTVMTAQQR